MTQQNEIITSFITKRKKPRRKAAIHPNFPCLYDDEPDEVFRFKKHHVADRTS